MAFDINNRYMQASRYRRRGKTGPIGVAIDLTVTPAFTSIGSPAAPTLAASASGGTLATASYNYSVSAINANGETLTSPQAAAAAAVTGPNGSVTVTWVAITGAAGYKIYGRTAGSQLLIAQVGAVTSWIDTGALAPAGAPPIVDTTGTIMGAVAGQVNAGDMLWRTTNGGVASLNTPGAGAANTANFLGVSEENYPMVLGLGAGLALGKPIGDPRGALIAIRTSGEFAFLSTPGDTYRPGDTVYLGANAQTVQKTVNGTPVGKVANDQSPVLGGGDGMSVTITGGATAQGLAQEVMVEITPPLAI